MSWDPKRTHTREQRTLAAWVIKRANGKCQINGRNCIIKATEDDHIVPLSQGGTDAPANHQAACKVCHGEKTALEATEARRVSAARAKRSKPQHPGLA